MRKVLLFCMAVLMSSCNRNLHETAFTDVEDVVVEAGAIPVSEALQTLDSFMQEGATKANGATERRIKSVETHYKTVESKAGTYRIPDAYIVQYEDAQGFAVLGATHDVDNIVAVIEKGTIDAKTLKVSSEGGDTELSLFVAEMIKNGLEGGRRGEDGDGGEGGEGGDGGEGGGESGDDDQEHDDSVGDPNHHEPGSGGAGSGSTYATRLPMLNFSWGQTAPYNEHCLYPLGLGNSVATGCSTTAMAMIMAGLGFPQTMIINGTLLDWSEMTSYYNLYGPNGSDAAKSQTALLMGSIFNFVSPAPVVLDGTLVLPLAIKNLMQDYGFVNVTKMSGSSLNNDMVAAISNMLRYNKPVFISAVPSLYLSHSHSWVIDGAKYSSSTYLLHCNFGWQGTCNGYFSRSCLNPSQGYEYDYNYTYNPDDDHTYNWHFRVITYDLPAYPYSLTVSY